jgi:phenylacetate-CoA ligase
MWVVGCPAVRALIDIGMRPIPVGAEGGAPRMLQMIDLLSPEVMICTPSMAEQMLERSEDVLGKPVSALSIRKILCCGEPGGGLPEVRKRLGDAYGARIYDGSAGAHMARVSCHTEEYFGMHMLTEDLVLTEMIDLETFEPVEQTDGALGRVLQTSLVHQARPLIKFDTGDVYQVFTSECPGCGHTLRRIKVLGRADDMLLIGGVNVYPSAIKDLVVQFAPRTTGEVRIVLTEPPPRVHPPLKLRVEAAEGTSGELAENLRSELETRIRDVLRFRASVELIDAYSLARSGGKTQLIVKEY